jgi:hypothetical protein
MNLIHDDVHVHVHELMMTIIKAYYFFAVRRGVLLRYVDVVVVVPFS